MGIEQKIGRPTEIFKPSSLEARRHIIKRAFEDGDFLKLAPTQQDVLRARGYLGDGPLVSFRRLVEQESLGSTFQAAGSRELRALRRLEKGVDVTSKMKPHEKEVLLTKRDLSASELADMLGHAQQTIRKWQDELGVPRIRLGLRIKPREKKIILANQDLSATKLAGMLDHGWDTISKWKDELGVPRRPKGRPRKNSPELFVDS